LQFIDDNELLRAEKENARELIRRLKVLIG